MVAPGEGGLTPGADLLEFSLKGQTLRAYPFRLQKETQNHSGFHPPGISRVSSIPRKVSVVQRSVAVRGGAGQPPAKFGVTDFP